MAIRNIIFDYGSVLVDWNPERVFRPYFQDDERMTHFLTEICPYEWNARGDAGEDLKAITDERAAMFPEWEKEIRMYFDRWQDMMDREMTPGMYDLVSELKGKGFGLYGLTNWSAQTFFPFMPATYPVFSLLDGMVISGTEKIVKPDPRIYRLLLERYGLDPQECVFVDDKAANVKGGEAVGIRGIVFESALQLRSELSRLIPALW